MKQKQQTTAPMPIDKGNGHTPGEVFISGGMVDGYELRSTNGEVIISKDGIYNGLHHKANAARIVESWNNYDQLKADKKILENAIEIVSKKHTELKADNKAKDETIRELFEALQWMIQTVKRDGIIDNVTHEGMIEDCENVIAKTTKAIAKHNQ